MALLLIVSSVMAYPVKINSWRINEDLKRLNELNFSIDNVNRNSNTIIVYVRDDMEFQKLSSHGFDAVALPDVAKEYADKLWEETKDSDNPMRDYYSIDQYSQFMQDTAAQYPGICQLVQIGSSTQNRPLYFMKISDNVTISENEPEFKYISSMHGDEVLGFDLLLRLIQLLTSQYGVDTRITNLVNSTEIWINPLMNPDGYVAHSRYNAAGIDLNRNFPMPTGSQHPDGESWAPETIAMMDFISAHSFLLSANFHGGEVVMNYPWDYTYTLAPDDAYLQQAALSYASHYSTMYNSSQFVHGITNGAAWYVTTGSYQDWNYGFTDCMDITAEVSSNKWPASSQLESLWNQNKESLLSYMEFVHKGINGTVWDNNNNPLAATISIAGNIKNTTTDPSVGDYHRLLLPGTYSITASAVGFVSQSVSVTVPISGQVVHNFILEPAQTMSFSGQVRDLNGQLINGASVAIGTPTPINLSTTATGTFAINSLYEGDYTVTINKTGFAVYQQVVQFRADSNAKVFVLSQPMFNEDFQSGLSNWSIQTPWATTVQSGNTVLTDSPSGNYSNNQNRSIGIANPISLQNVQNPVLSFSNKYNLESGYDFVYVEATPNGSTWTVLGSFTGQQSSWQTSSFSLNAFTGSSTFRFRFRLNTDSAVTADGIYIDDVQISGMQNGQVVYGDIDGNWIVDSDDVQHALDYSIGLDPIVNIDPLPWTDARVTACDVDGNDSIDAIDAYLIGKFIREAEYLFPTQSGIEFTAPANQVVLSHVNNNLRISFEQASTVYGVNMSLSAANGLSINSIQWGSEAESQLTAENITQNKWAWSKLSNTSFDYVDIDYSTMSGMMTLTINLNGVNYSSDIIAVTAVEDQNAPALSLSLRQNYPNPFNPSTTISFTIPDNNTPVTLNVYNIKGQLIRTLMNALVLKGNHSVTWNGEDNKGHIQNSGVYIYKLSTPSQIITKKMILVK
jgi:hypothetical protein